MKNFIKKLQIILKFFLKVYNILVKIVLSTAVIRRAVGRFGGQIIAIWKGKITYLRRTYKEKQASELQKKFRELFKKVDALWGDLSDPEKDQWRKAAPPGQTNYSYFMSINLTRAYKGLPLIRIPQELRR